MPTVRLELATGALEQQFQGPGGMAAAYVNRLTTDIRNRAVLYAPVDTGRLRGSITPTLATPAGGMTVTGRVGTDVNYAVYVHEGVTDRDVTVHEHTVRAHKVRAHTVAARSRLGYDVATRGGASYHVGAHTIGKHRVHARTRLSHVRGTYTRHQHARDGRPFLRRAMDEVVDANTSGE